MESTQSKRPPLPGIMLPESFILAERFNIDSAKSPTMAEKATHIARIVIFIGEPINKYGTKKYPIKPAVREPKNPPAKPAMLLFGLALIKPRLFFPNRTPKNHAKLSHKNTISKNIAIA